MKTVAVFLCVIAIVLAEGVLDKRIVNGEKAELYAHPHQASLQLFQDSHGWYHICGAVLVGPNKLVTAAHCVQGQDATKLRVEVGALNLLDPPNAYEQTIPVEFFIIHPLYNEKGNAYPNDIAILYLSSPVTYNKNVQPAELAPKGSSFANEQCIITGWGRTIGGGPTAAHLKQAYISKITRSQCNLRWALYGQLITDKHICVYEASDPAGTRPSACQGDSGGPLMCGADFKLLAGVTSWGLASCTGGMPSVYTRVSEYVDWVEAN
uniref:Serine peptidase 2 n=1 Tax=Peregriana peregra TaxID=2529398 RepID=A1ED52_9GAST|nr:serine peptidase 2 [Peregriana peregra]